MNDEKMQKIKIKFVGNNLCVVPKTEVIRNPKKETDCHADNAPHPSIYN